MHHSLHDTSPAPAARACAETLLAASPALAQCLRLGIRAGFGPQVSVPKVSVPQYRLLAHASQRPGATLRELAEALGVSTATASRMVETLVVRGLVQRRPGTADRRQAAIALTPAGQQALDQTRLRIRQRLEAQLAVLNTPALATLRSALDLPGTVFGIERRPAPTVSPTPPAHDREERT